MRRTLIVAGAIVIVALVLNVFGIIRYPGGPLREPGVDGFLGLDIRPADWGSSQVGNAASADWATTDTDLVFSAVWLNNPSPWAATVEAITLIDVAGDLVAHEFLVQNPDAEEQGQLSVYGPLTSDQRAIIDRDYAPLPALIEPGETSRNVALVARAVKPGAAGFEALALDYRLGPFTFRVVHHRALHACLGMTIEERVCPGYD